MTKPKTIRLVMPQWQGGNNPLYHLGAELLEFLAPHTNVPSFTVPVTKSDMPLENENGIVGRKEVVKQLQSAYAIINSEKPDKIVMFGGDCLVDLAPFSYLGTVYGKSFGILWIDAHPDVMTPEQFANSHAHVLGALMGNGDPDLVKDVKTPVPVERVMIAGIHHPTDYEKQFLQDHEISTVSPEQLKTSDQPVLDWIKKQNIEYLAIHLDLDVLDFHLFHALLMAEPGVSADKYAGIAEGRLTMDDVIKLVNDVNEATTIVGIGIAEHLPWDALHLKNMLAGLPLVNGN
ncbi:MULTISPECIES: arginase family protein [Bartonella]|uniref:arginase family protein n=1 Tax=Bartonella TaxID=773 RepID=UPI0018DE9B52|nr:MULTISPECIES: arginase family protein [Bartonella]MBH9974955.1 arginase family protein [Bartonella choladocola]MBI0014561.1 arginase family protein [Bartonella sp. B10834G3]